MSVIQLFISVILFIAFFVFTLNAGHTVSSFLHKRVDFLEDIGKEFRESNLNAEYYVYLWMGSTIGGFATGVLMFNSMIVGLILAGFIYCSAYMLIEYLRNQRKRELEEQLVSAADLMANSIRAGVSLPQAVRTVSDELSPPISEEFDILTHLFEHGRSIDEALRIQCKELNSQNFNLIANALIVARERGGNISEILDRIADAVREMHRLDEHIRTETTEGRYSAIVISMMPMVVALIYFSIAPETMSNFFNDPAGMIIIGIAIVLNIVAYMWINSIMDLNI